MKRIMHWLVPKEEKFFEMLAEQSLNVLKSANELKNFVDSYPDIEKNERKSKAASIKKLEQLGDEIQNKIIYSLDKNFRTPADSEDIRKLADLLDDTADLINTLASSFIILSIERIDDYTIKFVDLAVKIIEEVNNGILDLKKLKDADEHCKKILKLESEADRLHDEALSDLLHYYKNPVDVIKYKEIYDLLENLSNKCKNISVVINSIITKHG
ncbi:MAG TPA: DUF47 family protein [Candidatus Nanoarchaeia archaeon]|nr:DUF47 family protein [Candidatus Nanoarchaeia archaeon]